MQKRVLTIQDISCVGRCSLTVALPIISAAGIETSVLPTAILSTHTGGFEGYTFRDLTDDIEPIAQHWASLGLRVDAFYTGYLGSFEQLRLVGELIDLLGSDDSLFVADPAMADNGQLYPAFDRDFAFGMRDLCARADLVVPNLTEATLMLDEPYVASGYDEAYIEGLLARLTALGPRQAVLTGVSFEEGRLGAASFDTAEGRVRYHFRDLVEGYYHGTGDVVASALVAAVVSGKDLAQATALAVDFTVECLERSRDAGTERRYGVDFENGLADFARAVKG